MEMQTPAINHVALTVDAAILQGPKREALKDFMKKVFDWEEIPVLTIDAKRLVFRIYRSGQFLYLISGNEPSKLQGADHFGIQVYERETLDRMVAAMKEYKRKDASVQIVDTKVNTENDTLRLWNAYVRYLLPLMIEVQYYEYKTVAAAPQGSRVASMAR